MSCLFLSRTYINNGIYININVGFKLLKNNSLTLYADNSNFVDSSNPWFNRGGNYDNGVLAGQFNFNRNTGGSNTNIGSRLVLAP